MSALVGGCQCGQVRYESNAQPLFSGNCHCRECQSDRRGLRARISRTGELIESNWRSEILREPRRQRQHIQPRICPDCGSRIFGKTSGFPQFVLITAGSLNDPSLFKPAMDFFTSSAQPWDYMDPKLPKFAKQPKV